MFNHSIHKAQNLEIIKILKCYDNYILSNNKLYWLTQGLISELFMIWFTVTLLNMIYVWFSYYLMLKSA